MARHGEGFGSDYRTDDNRDRWRDDERERSSWRSGGQGSGERDDERGFFQRAGDEIRSWFNEEDDDRRSSETYGRDYERGGFGRSSWDRENLGRPVGSGGGFSDRDRERPYGRFGRGGSNYVNEDRSEFARRSSVGQFGRSGSNWDRESEARFAPPRGRFNRDENRFGSSGPGFGGFRDESDFRTQHRSHPQRSEGDRSESESLGYGEFRGTLGGFGNQTFGSSQDDHYRSWRDLQMSQLDSDYADYCREREQQFNQDFDSWRRSRQSQSPSAAPNASGGDLGAASNAGVGTTTSSMTGTAGTGSATGSATTNAGATQSDTTETAGTGGSRSGSRSRN